ncbi:MAG: Npt1/Npt2 family nucleotide transporter [bacterium]
MANPFKVFMDIRRQELPLSLLMASYFFLTITTFWILKPLKKAMFIQFYRESGFDLLSWHLTAVQAEQIAKILNMVVAFAAVVVFTWLARRFRRQQLCYILSGFIIACLAIYYPTINNPHALTVWTFYLFGDLFTTLMVAGFFAFLNDSVTPDAAKRLYGVIVFGGVVGGAFGASILRLWVDALSPAAWMGICVGLVTLIWIIAGASGRIVSQNPPPEPIKPASRPSAESSKSVNPVLEGAKLVFRSRYLLAIVAVVGLYEIASQVLEFQFTQTLTHYLKENDDFTRHLSTWYAVQNIVSMFVQLFLTSFVMTRFGVKTALLILPVIILGASAGFLVFPILWVGSFLTVANNSFHYSINQSSKETLYVPTSRDEKYKAKAFIDMFVQRFAKVLAVGVNLAMSAAFVGISGARWLSVFTGVVVILWIFAARYAGRKFDEITAES